MLCKASAVISNRCLVKLSLSTAVFWYACAFLVSKWSMSNEKLSRKVSRAWYASGQTSRLPSTRGCVAGGGYSRRSS
ncbi:hypothetical protein BC567DRAFT_238149 [Phyllosticta citribraziliensis]